MLDNRMEVQYQGGRSADMGVQPARYVSLLDCRALTDLGEPGWSDLTSRSERKGVARGSAEGEVACLV